MKQIDVLMDINLINRCLYWNNCDSCQEEYGKCFIFWGDYDGEDEDLKMLANKINCDDRDCDCCEYNIPNNRCSTFEVARRYKGMRTDVY